MATIEYFEKPKSPLVAMALMPTLLAFITRWRLARRAAHSARIERILSNGLSAIE
jgi:hypothetical protein